MQLIFTPAMGCSSYRVTEGPREISSTRVRTPKLSSVSTSFWAVSYTHLDFHEQPFEVCNPLLIPGKLLLQDGQLFGAFHPKLLPCLLYTSRCV